MLELEILKQLKHPNIITLVDSFLNDDVLILVMEYCESKMKKAIQNISRRGFNAADLAKKEIVKDRLP